MIYFHWHIHLYTGETVQVIKHTPMAPHVVPHVFVLIRQYFDRILKLHVHVGFFP